MKLRYLSISALCFFIMACGGNGSSTDSGNGAPVREKSTESGLLKTAEAYYSTSIKSPAKLYDFFTDACKEVLSKDDFLGQIAIGTSMFEGMYGFKLSEVKFSNVRLSNVTENSGQSQADAVGPDGTALDSSEVVDWVYENGAWRTSNDCDLNEDGNADLGNSGSSSDSELRPAAEVKEEGIRESAIVGEVGTEFSLGGLPVLISAVEYFEDVDDDGTGSDFRIAVDLRVENRTGESKSAPSFEIACLPNGDTGSWYVDSTYDMYGELPDGSFMEGRLLLGVPAGCLEPVIRGQSQEWTMNGNEEVIDWSVPQSALAG